MDRAVAATAIKTTARMTTMMPELTKDPFPNRFAAPQQADSKTASCLQSDGDQSLQISVLELRFRPDRSQINLRLQNGIQRRPYDFRPHDRGPGLALDGCTDFVECGDLTIKEWNCSLRVLLQSDGPSGSPALLIFPRGA